MKARALWLIATSVLFLAWLGWLGYLAWTTSRPIVLSRPQLLVSTVDVIAEVQEKDGKPADQAKVLEVHWPPNGPEQKLVGQTIHVVNLPESEFKWIGPGQYILPLVKDGNAYRVAEIPLSPGFDPDLHGEHPRIYPRTAETIKQLDSIRKMAGQSSRGDLAWIAHRRAATEVTESTENGIYGGFQFIDWKHSLFSCDSGKVLFSR